METVAGRCLNSFVYITGRTKNRGKIIMIDSTHMTPYSMTGSYGARSGGTGTAQWSHRGSQQYDVYRARTERVATFNACNQPYAHGYVNDHALRWLRPHLRRSTHEEASRDASWSVDPSCDRPSRPSRHRHATRNHLRHIIHQHQTTHSCILTHTIRRITGDLPYEPQLMRMSPVSSSIDQWEWAGY